MNKVFKVKFKDIYKYEGYAIECPNCQEQIELDGRHKYDVVCPFCNVDIEIGDEENE